MAELVAVPSDWVRVDGVVTLGATSPIERGALVEPLHTVINGQDQARIEAGERVLVLGLGPIGVLHVASARSRGARVVGVDPDADRVARAATILGPDAVDRMDGGWAARARAGIGDGGGVDVVIVAVGAQRALATALELVEPGGRILAFAGMPPDDRILQLDLNDLHYRQLSLVGAFGGTPDTFRRAAAWLATHDLDIAVFTPERFALGDAVAAFEAAAAGRGLKTLIVASD
jgi:L-iditol 2-dehydrogenase